MIKLNGKYFKDIYTAVVVEREFLEDQGLFGGFKYTRWFDININGVDLEYELDRDQAQEKLDAFMEKRYEHIRTK